jgi:hypothetical protein
MSTKFIIGMILLVTNQVVGYAGLLGAAYLVKKTKKKYWAAVGTVVYAISWGMFFLGAYLAGKEGLDLCKLMIKKYGWWALAVAAPLIAAGIIIYVKKRKKKIQTAPSA